MKLLKAIAASLLLTVVVGSASVQDASGKVYKPMSEQKEKTQAVLKAIKSMEKKGRNMQNLRTSGDISDMQQCMQFMRQRQTETKKIYLEAESLPIDVSLPLRTAATELQLCVSCMSTAIESCNRAKERIKDAEEVLKTPWKQRRELIGDLTNQ